MSAKTITYSIIFTSFFSFQSFSQDSDRLLDFRMANSDLSEVLDSLSTISNYNFSYNSDLLPSGSLFTFNYRDKTISQILTELFVGLNLEFAFEEGDQIIIKKRKYSRKPGSNKFSISGYVREKDQPTSVIRDVLVYLDGSTLVASTDEHGYFKLEGIPLGSYRLIFSHLSYKKKIFEISKSTTKELFVNTDLEIEANVLEAIEVESSATRKSRKNRPKYLDTFQDQFIGTSNYAGNCVLINPDVIQFDYNRTYKSLYAFSNKPIVIQNNSLGYTLYCELDDFLSTENTVKFIGRVRFEELDSNDDKIIKTWVRNRKLSYEGSIRHFFKSVIEGNYAKQGFQVSFVDEVTDINMTGKDEYLMENLLKETDIPLRWEINLENILHVTYLKELESSAYLADMEREFRSDISNPNKMLFLKRNPQNQRSIIEITEGPIYVDVNGHIVNPEGLSVSGYWSWERIANLVPINYEIK